MTIYPLTELGKDKGVLIKDGVLTPIIHLTDIDKNELIGYKCEYKYFVGGTLSITTLFFIISISNILVTKKNIIHPILFLLIIITSIIILCIPYTNCYQRIIKNINDSNYDVIVINNLLNDNECDELIEYAKTKNFITSETTGDNGNITSDYRTSTQIWIDDRHHAIARKITNITEKLIGLPKQNMESLQFVRYDVSGYFKQHYDPEVDKKKVTSNIIDRAHTLLIYLNDVEDGGGTEFVNLKLTIKPKKGTAVYFKSLNDNGELLVNSLHQGLPILKGEKFIVNKWIHLNKFNKLN